jgi:hypothetical protein
MSIDLERRLREVLAETRTVAVASPTAPPEILRRARRRARVAVVVGAVTALAVVALVVVGTQSLLDREPGRAGGDGSTEPLPTDGPFPEQSSLLLDGGEVDGEPWALQVTSGPSGYGLSFEYEGLGGGGGSLDPMRGDRLFGGFSFSTQPDFPDHDRTRPPLPFAIPGQVRSDVAQVVFELEPVPDETPLVVEASLYDVPEELVGPTRVILLWIPGDTLLVAGELRAFDEDGNLLGNEYLDASPVPMFPKVLEESTPEAVAVMKQLQLAGAIVGRYHTIHGSFSGLDPTTANEISPAIVFNESQVAIPGEVSLRVAGPQDLVLASATAAGEVYSACFVGGPGVAGYGRNDTSDPYTCTNGWLNPDESPPPRPGSAIATGSDPNGNLWSLALVTMGDEVGLEYLYATIGTYLPVQRLGDDDLGTTTAVPPTAQPTGSNVEGLASSVYGIASDRVERIELRVAGGEAYEAELYPIAAGMIDAEQAFLILAPIDEPFSGIVVAYDAAGDELASREVSTVR